MFGANVQGGLTFTKVLSGISKTLSVANQVIPLYREAKPMIKNAKTILSVLKEMNGNNNNKTPVKKQNGPIKKDSMEEVKTFTNYNNSPKFFL